MYTRRIIDVHGGVLPSVPTFPSFVLQLNQHSHPHSVNSAPPPFPAGLLMRRGAEDSVLRIKNKEE